MRRLTDIGMHKPTILDGARVNGTTKITLNRKQFFFTSRIVFFLLFSAARLQNLAVIKRSCWDYAN